MGWRDRAIPVSGGAANKAAQGSWRDRAIPVQNWVDNLTTTEQVMHPDISMADRLIAKNFSQDQGKQVEYLKQQYPGLEFDVSVTNQIRAKKPGSKVWNVLDPDTGIFSSDTLRDIGDIGFDVYSAATEGAATAGGALLGTPAGPAGMLGGAAVAGGATTAANEGIRQKLGQYLGIPQEVSGEDVAMSGAIGAASPLLFGAGKAKGAIPYAMGKVGQGLKKINPLPWIGEKVSGVPREVLRNYADDGTRETVERLEREGIDDYSGKIYDKLKSYVEGNKEKAGKELVETMDNIGSKVDITEAKASFKKAISEIYDKADDQLTNADAKKLDEINRIYSQYFGLDSGDGFIDDSIKANKAWQLQKDLKQVGKYGSDMKPEELHTKGIARDSYSKLNQAFDDASDGMTSKAKKQYAAAVQEEAELLPKFTGKTRADSIQKTYNEMSRLDRQGRKVMQERLSKLSDSGALDLSDEAKTLATYRWLGNPTLAPVSSAGTTSTSRTIPLAIAGGSLGSLAGYNAGGGYAGATVGGAAGATLGTMLGSPAAMKAYIRAMRAAAKTGQRMTPEDASIYRAINNALATEYATDPK